MSWFGQASSRALRQVKISAIERNPQQPRKYFDQEGLAQLSQSIRQFGVLNPLTVRRKGDGGYELIAGERRLRAAKLAGLSQVPCLVLTADQLDSAAMALVENLQRADLDYFEEALGYRHLMEQYGLTQDQVAQKVGRTQSSVANKLRLLRLSQPIRQRLREEGLTERHGRALLRLPEEEQLPVLEHIIAKGYNVGQAEHYIEEWLRKATQPPKGQLLRYIRDVRLLINTIDKAVDAMQHSGIAAQLERVEEGETVRLTVTIPKGKVAVKAPGPVSAPVEPRQKELLRV